MFFLNLSAVEFFALFSVVSGAVVALYLLDKSRKKHVVPTLRFWIHSDKPPAAHQRKRIQQPLSLLLQIVSILLLLLALAQLRLGSPEKAARDHVLIIDTSAWMSATTKNRTLMDEARVLARAYVRALPSSDRVMIVRADALATPATTFESNRATLEDAIKQSKPGSAALNIEQAFDFAAHLQKLHSRQPGEIVYAGAGRALENRDGTSKPPPNLRLLAVSEISDNVGLKKISLRRSAADGELWEIYVTVKNYGAATRVVPVALAFGSAPIGSARLQVPGGGEANSKFEFRTRAAGWLEARLQVKDAIAADDRAVLELPAQKAADVIVYSDEPEPLRALLTANRNVKAVFKPTATYDAAAKADVVIIDRFRPSKPPVANAVVIEPPREGSPAPVMNVVKDVSLSQWRGDHPLSAGLHTKDLKLGSALIFGAATGFAPVAEAAAGPVIVAREASPRLVVFGFHPAKSSLKYELAAPLLFANILQWMAPDSFLRREMTGESVGAINVALDATLEPAQVRVLDESGQNLPFTLSGRTLRFFGGSRGIVRVIAGGQEFVYSLSLPEVAEAKWEPPARVKRGIPKLGVAESSSRDIWQWLAILGGIGLAAEWLMFGRFRAPFQRASAQASAMLQTISRLARLRRAS